MNRIKEVLEQKGIKQTWIAKKLGKSYNMVNGYVQNRQQPRLEVLNEIAIILDVDVRNLIVSNKSDGNEEGEDKEFTGKLKDCLNKLIYHLLKKNGSLRNLFTSFKDVHV